MITAKMTHRTPYGMTDLEVTVVDVYTVGSRKYATVETNGTTFMQFTHGGPAKTNTANIPVALLRDIEIIKEEPTAMNTHGYDAELLADAFEAAVEAAQEVHKEKYGFYHHTPERLWSSLDFDGHTLSTGGPYSKEWNIEMFQAAAKAFWAALKSE